MSQAFINTDAVYTCSHVVAVRSHRVIYPDLESFHRALQGFERVLGDDAADGYWRPFLRQLRRYRFELSSCPLPPAHPEFDAARALASLEAHLSQCNLLFQRHASAARNLLDAAIQLSTLNTNPLLDAIVSTFVEDEGRGIALLVKEPRRGAAISEALAGTLAVGTKVLGIHQLREDTTYERLIILGSSAWFPGWVFSAPRARGVDYTRCSWLRCDWQPQFAFANTKSVTLGRHTIGKPAGAPAGEAATPAADSGAYAVEDDPRRIDEAVLPVVDWDAISAPFERASSPMSTDEEVMGRLLLLEGDVAVFLEASDSAKALVIDLDEDAAGEDDGGGKQFTRMLIQDIEPGMFVLLRTSGGGDYILPLADKFLGAEANRSRERQRHWKSLLHAIAAKEGLLATSIRLLDLGAVRADENNLRNWLSDRNIRPHGKADFEAIMKLTGLESLIPEYWKNTAAIYRAHQRAGFQIRRLLLRQAKSLDFEELQQAGRIDIELPEAGAGSLTVFRVVAISERDYVVHSSQLGVPFESGGIWQG